MNSPVKACALIWDGTWALGNGSNQAVQQVTGKPVAYRWVGDARRPRRWWPWWSRQRRCWLETRFIDIKEQFQRRGNGTNPNRKNRVHKGYENVSHFILGMLRFRFRFFCSFRGYKMLSKAQFSKQYLCSFPVRS